MAALSSTNQYIKVYSTTSYETYYTVTDSNVLKRFTKVFYEGDKSWNLCSPIYAIDKYQNFQKLHRLDGPAIELVSGEKEFWIDCIMYSELEYWIAVEKYKKEHSNE